MAIDSRLDLDDRAELLLAPVADVIRAGLDRLPPVPPLRVELGEVEGFARLHGATLTLSSPLDGPAIHHVDEPQGPIPPLDRWRRAAGCVLEAVATLALARQVRLPIDPTTAQDWRWVGAAIHAADRVAPELGIAWPDLALAIRTANPGRHPRAGVAVMRAWEARGQDPLAQVRYLLGGGVLSGPEWLEVGSWILSPRGASSELPVSVARPEEVDIPVALGPWSWVALRIPPHPRGGRLEVEGGGEIGDPWAPGGATHRTIAGATEGPCRVIGTPGGPLGDWTVASAEGFGQVMGARGIAFTFQRTGVARIVLADAFVGPLAAVAMADHVGTSGVVEGRWRVAGPHQLAFEGITPHSLTMHGRSQRRHDRFMMPAGGFGLGEWLEALSDAPWGWEQRPDRLVMRGTMMGGPVEVRMRREG